MTKKKSAAAPIATSATAAETLQLYPCEASDWMWMPKSIRLAIAWITIVIFGLSFLIVPMCVVFLIPAVWRNAPVAAGSCLGLLVLSMLLPMKEW